MVPFYSVSEEKPFFLVRGFPFWFLHPPKGKLLHPFLTFLLTIENVGRFPLERPPLPPLCRSCGPHTGQPGGQPAAVDDIPEVTKLD